MTQPAKHTPLHKAIHALPMLYAEAFAGSNNREFVVELYKDAQLLETAAPAMYEALVEARAYIRRLADCTEDEAIDLITNKAEDIEDDLCAALAQAEGKQ